MMIAHTCTSCGHGDYYASSVTAAQRHNAAGRQWPNKTCGQGCHGHGRAQCDWAEPTLRKTFGPDGKVQPEILAPGVNAGGWTPCGCDDCLYLYERVKETATEAVEPPLEDGGDHG